MQKEIEIYKKLFDNVEVQEQEHCIKIVSNGKVKMVLHKNKVERFHD